jgi:hypothetical protein
VYDCSNGQWKLSYQCSKDKECRQSNALSYCATKSVLEEKNKTGFELFSIELTLIFLSILILGLIIGAGVYVFLSKTKKSLIKNNPEPKKEEIV